jgi:hypothetical protein
MILSGALALCAIGALLLDTKMYLSAAVVGLVGVILLITFPWQYFRVRRENRERERRNVEEAGAEAARIRDVQIDMAKTMIAEAAKAASSSATNVAEVGLKATRAAAQSATSGAATVADLTRSGVSGARDKLASWRKKSE